jgi:type III pantothenate kinase
MNSLLLDLGNSRIKWAWRTADGLSEPMSAPRSAVGIDELIGAVQTRPAATAWLASVVEAPARTVSEALQARGWTVRRARSMPTLAGLHIGYRNPAQLGVDRFLVLLAARELLPGRDCLVVDAGTALTTDHLQADGRHLGGTIIPGLGLMRAALAGGTDRLGAALAPAAATSPAAACQPTGAGLPATALIAPAHDTRSAIETGILSAALGAITLQRRPDLPLLLCGGDAAELARWLPQPWQLVPELVLLGLSRYAQLSEPASD